MMPWDIWAADWGPYSTVIKAFLVAMGLWIGMLVVLTLWDKLRERYHAGR